MNTMNDLNFNCINEMCDVLIRMKDVSVEKRLYAVDSKLFVPFEKKMKILELNIKTTNDAWGDFDTSTLINTLIIFANELKTQKINTPHLGYVEPQNSIMLHYQLVIDEMKRYTPEKLREMVFTNIEPWQLYAEKHKVDISDVIEKIEQECLRFKPLAEITQLQNELKNILNISDLSSKLYDTFLILRTFIDDKNTVLDENSKVLYDLYSKKHEELQESLKNTVLNKSEYASLESLMEHVGFNETLQNIRSHVNSISDKIANSAGISFSDAHVYKKNHETKKESNLYQFIKHKVEESDELFDYSSVHIKNGKYRTFMMFDDSSALVIDDKNNIKVLRDNREADIHIHHFLEEILSEKLNKNPTINKVFQKVLKKHYVDFHSAIIAAETFLDNQDILKIEKFDFLNQNYTSFENLDDNMNETIREHQFKKFAFSIVSNKYKHLYNDETMEILKELHDMGITSTTLQDLVGKKIAAYKNASDFNAALNKMFDVFNKFSMNYIVEQADECQAIIVSKEDNLLIVKINNFEQSQALGSNSWCLSRESHYYNSYTSDNAKQYFIYDFNKNSKNKDSMIGLTLSSSGLINNSHYKNDDACGYEYMDRLKDLQLKIVKNTLHDYPEIDSTLKNRLVTEENNLTKIRPSY